MLIVCDRFFFSSFLSNISEVNRFFTNALMHRILEQNEKWTRHFKRVKIANIKISQSNTFKKKNVEVKHIKKKLSYTLKGHINKTRERERKKKVATHFLTFSWFIYLYSQNITERFALLKWQKQVSPNSKLTKVSDTIFFNNFYPDM